MTRTGWLPWAVAFLCAATACRSGEGAEREAPRPQPPAAAEAQCPQATPEIFRVEPVQSPTSQLQQVISVRIGNGERVTVESESGVFVATGGFSAFAQPAQVTVTLKPGTAHHLRVSGRVREVAGPAGCRYGGYVLSTERDRNGAPLTIVQSATASAPPTSPPAATRPATGVTVATAAPAVRCTPVAFDALTARTARPAELAAVALGGCVTIQYRAGDTSQAIWYPAGARLGLARVMYVRHGDELITIFSKDGVLMAREFIPGKKSEDLALLREGDRLLLAASRTPVFRAAGAEWTALVDTLARD